jgi:putative flippase GtrA
MRADGYSLSQGAFEAGRFLLVGVANSLVDASLYFALSSGVFLLILPKLIAKAAAYLAGVANSFYWNRRWTFRSARPISRTLLPFILSNLVGLALNVGMLHIALDVFRLPEILAIAVATACAVIWNFTINKYLVFKSTAR